MTLVEIVIAFAVLMLVLIPTTTLLVGVLRQANTARERLTALSLAEQYLELLNNSGPPLNAHSLPTTTNTITEASSLVKSGVTYKVTAKFTWAGVEQTTQDMCVSGTTPKVLALHVKVAWAKTRHTITDSTLLNYPPDGIPVNGYLAIQVNGDPATGPPADRLGHTWATRVTTVPVVVTKNTSHTSTTIYPNGYGCAFAEETPGTYKVQVKTPATGTHLLATTNTWVANYNQATTQVQSTLQVTAGDVTAVTFEYDEGALVGVSYPSTTATEGGVTCKSVGSILCVATGQASLGASAPATAVAEISWRTSSGWASTVLSTKATRLAAVTCVTTQCIGVGYLVSSGSNVGASVSAKPTSSPTFAANTVPSGVTSLTGITCPSAKTCFAYGKGSSGAVILKGTVSSSGVSWAKQSISGTVPTTLTGMACPSATECFAIGKKSSTVGTILYLSNATWYGASFTSSSTVTTLTGLVCPSTTACFVTGTANTSGHYSQSSSTPVILSLATPSTGTWTTDTVSTSSIVTITTITCPSSTVCFAIASKGTTTGYRYTASTTTILALSASSGGYGSPGPTWKSESVSVPSGQTLAGLNALTCASTTFCFAIGSTTTGPLIDSYTSTSSDWNANTLPSTVTSLEGITCPSTSHCLASGAGSLASGRSGGVILYRSTTKTRTWTKATVPSTAVPVFLNGIACTGTSCSAVGGTESGALYLNGSLTSTAWTAATPTLASGVHPAKLPITIANVSMLPIQPIEWTAPTSTATQIGPLFPFSTGFSVSAAECPAQLANASVVTSTPGQSASTTVTVPLGVLALQAVTPSGTPIAGVTIRATLKDTTCTNALLTPLSGTNTTSFTLQTTGAFGLSEEALIYDTYTVKLTTGTSHHYSKTLVVTVTPTAILVVTGSTSVSFPLPEPVAVKLT